MCKSVLHVENLSNMLVFGLSISRQISGVLDIFT